MYKITFIIIGLIITSFRIFNLPEVDAELEESYEGIGGALNGPSCSLACAMSWTITTTSTLASQGLNNYESNNISDGLASTAWVEGVKGSGIGEQMIATVNSPEGASEVPFYGIEIANGYQKDEQTWISNSRIKKLKIYHNATPKLIVKLQDRIGAQSARWSPDLIKLNNGDKIIFEIIEIYKGTKYEDTAISDLVLHGAH